MDQESSGIDLVYVCVCEGDVGRLECGFFPPDFERFFKLSRTYRSIFGLKNRSCDRRIKAPQMSRTGVVMKRSK